MIHRFLPNTDSDVDDFLSVINAVSQRWKLLDGTDLTDAQRNLVVMALYDRTFQHWQQTQRRLRKRWKAARLRLKELQVSD